MTGWLAETAEVVALSAAVGALGGLAVHLILGSHGGKVEGMTRQNDDKAGNNEFEGSEPKEAKYNAKVEARFTKQAKATAGQDGQMDSRKIDKSHADDGGEHRF